MAWHDGLGVLGTVGRWALLPPGWNAGPGPVLTMAAAFWMATYVVHLDLMLRDAWDRATGQRRGGRRAPRGARRTRVVRTTRGRPAWVVLTGRRAGSDR
jgi:hypothetical protein